MAQFSKKAFARGVKLTRQHVYDPAQQIAAAYSSASVNLSRRAPIVFNYSLPVIDAAASEYAHNQSEPCPIGWLPMILPPTQDQWRTDRAIQPAQIVLLEEVSLSWDQQANPYACAGSYNAISTDPVVQSTLSSQMPNVDQSRLNLTLVLYERKPTVDNGDDAEVTEVYRQEVPGLTFLDVTLRNNPTVFAGLQVQIKPYCCYYWALYAPNLYPDDPNTADGFLLALPSLTLCVTCTAPLIAHRNDAQNFPLAQVQVNPPPYTVTPPASNSPITGNDVQQVLDNLEAQLNLQMPMGVAPPSGNGADLVQAAEASTRQPFTTDTALSVIAIPMFSPYILPGVQAAQCAEAVLPGYTAVDKTAPAWDRACIRVPDGFIIDNVFACMNLYSPPAPDCVGTTVFGDEDLSLGYTNFVGVGITSGLNSDQFAQQQVAYGAYTAANLPTWTVDAFYPRVPGAGQTVQVPGFRILQVPLVWNVARSQSYCDNGKQFYVGGGNNVSNNRTACGQQPYGFGGGNLIAPNTGGTEQLLEVRWLKQNSVDGLDDPANPSAVRVGSLGEWIIITGTMPIGA